MDIVPGRLLQSTRSASYRQIGGLGIYILVSQLFSAVNGLGEIAGPDFGVFKARPLP